MSAQELRQRIEQLSTQIDFHKKLLQELERDKILAHRQLNAVLDPVARLPPEISSGIFFQSLTPFPKPGASHAPMLLLNICSTWSAVALSTPDLWRAIQIDFPCTENLAELLPIWFQRARNRPLSVLLRGDLSGRWNPSVSALIWRHGARLKHLELSFDRWMNDGEDAEYGDIPFDIFRLTTPAPFLLLERLTISGLPPGHSTHRQIFRKLFTPSHILRPLRLAPNIVECIFDSIPLIPFPRETSDSARLVLPTLRRLRFESLKDIPRVDVGILGCLSLPALEDLSVPMCAVADGGLVRFLKQSAPPLRQLALYTSQGRDFSKLHECLCLIPTLEAFEIWWDAQIMDQLLVTLTNSDSLLPNLRSLTVHTGVGISDYAWRTLVRAVSTRRIHLRLCGERYQAPPTDVLAAFKELIGDGVEIDIQAYNFMVG
ncbi:F-box domain-containing protein [Mycena sanguinolenta]|uniref:F-box domain-containing protein n=1 Tax=Mycena sanguinolenta TaxID=230812 RepID=A0A8H6YI16_9AGAR|nr:F-box domain-containing protein [Mycena sanguinolenta]